MKTKNVNLLFALVAVLLFGFSCFCISRMNQTNNQLINCRNHVLEFKETMLRLKNKSENNHQNLVKVLHQLKHKVAPAKPSGSILEKKVNMLDQDETVFNQFEVLKFFLPHLRTAGNIYPDIAIGRQRAGVSFALGITTIDRGNHTYLKQTLTSVLSRMTPEEEEDSVVIVSVADTDENYLKSVVHMVKTRFRKQVQSGALEVISIPALFYPQTLLEKKTTKNAKNWQIKQVLDFCILMLYAQPKATYYLQLEDDIVAKKMYFTKMKDFVNSVTSKDWFYIEFSVLGFIGKLFRSKDLMDFVHFFLIFYRAKPIDVLLDDIALLRMCSFGGPLELFAAKEGSSSSVQTISVPACGHSLIISRTRTAPQGFTTLAVADPGDLSSVHMPIGDVFLNHSDKMKKKQLGFCPDHCRVAIGPWEVTHSS